MNLEVSIDNFKSIVNTQIELKEGLNILIGPNGAGKTCILSSLKFLRDVLMQGAGLAMAKGGGPSRIYHRGKKVITFKISFEYGRRTYKLRKRDVKCCWIFSIEQKGKEKIATITYERVTLLSHTDAPSGSVQLFDLEINRSNVDKPKTKLFFDENLGKDLFSMSRFDNNKQNKQRIFDRLKSRLNDLTNAFKKEGDRAILSNLVFFDDKFEELSYLLSSLTEYNILPERARQPTEQVPFAKMSANGFGISEVIEALSKSNYHKIFAPIPENSNEYEMYRFDPFIRPRYYYYGYKSFTINEQNLKKALSNINRELSAAVRPISEVAVRIDETTGRRFVVFKTSDGHTFYPDEVSDGTMKWLCILTSIYVVFSNIYLLEEPENFLHPWMQQMLIQIMRDQAKNNNTIFLLTTHSTTILNSSYPSEIIVVKPTKKGTVTSRISNQEEVDDFLTTSDFRLGDLWISGGIGAIPE